MIPEMHPVKSSNIHSVGYHDETGKLHVQFKSGNGEPGAHHAYPCPKEHFTEMMGADSVGSYFHKNIRGNNDIKSERIK